MSPTKFSAMSTDDCDILYEKITSSNQCETQSISGNHPQSSNTIHCSGRVDENRNCANELMESEYPHYAADELSLFHELQSEVMPSSADMKTSLNESIDLEIETLGDDSPVNYPDPEKDSDSMDCKVLWAKYADSSKPTEDQSAKKLDVTKNSEVLQPETVPKNCDPPKSLKTNVDLDSISLSKSIHDISSFLEQRNADKWVNLEMESEKTTISVHRCEICKTSLPTIYELKVHLLDHVNDTMTSAEIYKKSILALQQLDFPVRTDKLKSKKRHNCLICKKVFLTCADLRWHRNITHLSDARPYQCQHCYKNYKRKCHLMRHESTHWKNK